MVHSCSRNLNQLLVRVVYLGGKYSYGGKLTLCGFMLFRDHTHSEHNISLQKNSYFNTEISIDMILIQNSTVQWSVISDKVLIAHFIHVLSSAVGHSHHGWCPSIGYQQCSSSLLCRVCPVCQLPFNDAAFVRYPMVPSLT